MGWHWVRVAAACVWAVLVAGCREDPSQRARTDLEVSPATLEFGPSALGVTHVRTLRVSNRSRASLTVQRVTSSLAELEVPLSEPFTLAAGGERELSVHLTPQAEGPLQGTLEVVVDDGGEPPRVEVSGRGVKAELEVQPTPLDFGSVELGHTRGRELVVRNPSEVAFELSVRVEGMDVDQFSAQGQGTHRLEPRGELRLPVTFQPTRLGAARAEVQVAACSTCPPVQVALLGTGVAALIEVSPVRMDFGRVAVGTTAEQRVVVRNHGTSAVYYGGARVIDDPEGAFHVSAAPSLPGDLLMPGAAVELQVAFTPAQVRSYGARLQVEAWPRDAQGPGPRVSLAGEGGFSCVAVVPPRVDYGVVALGMSASRTLQVHNRCTEEVLLGERSLALRQGGYFTLDRAPTSVAIAPGQSAPITVTFLPRREELSEAGLSLEVLEGSARYTEVVELRGEGRELPPCRAALEPRALDFGPVPLQASVSLGLGLRNAGSSACYLAGMQLAAGTDSAFEAEPVEPQLLEPGQQAMLYVRFTPPRAGSYQGLVEAWVNATGSGHLLASVRGEGVEGCFSARPATLNFGTVRLSCPPGQRELRVANRCTGPATLSGIRLDGTDEFLVSHGLFFPQVLPPGAELSIPITYRPREHGEDSAALRFELAAGGGLTVGLRARGSNRDEVTDTFIQRSQAVVDVLFVVDNSGSMLDEQQNLGGNFAAFLTHANAARADYQIAVATTGIEPSTGGTTPCPGGASGGEAGRLFPVDNSRPRIIKPSTPGADALFSLNTQVGVCHWNEQGLEAAWRALSEPLVGNADDPRTPLPMDGNAGFLRPEARLALIFLSDEEDSSPQPVAFYEQFFRALKGGDPSKLTISAIVGPERLGTCPRATSSGTRYLQLARATGGIEESICTPNWAESLERLSESAFGLDRVFPLSEQPLDTSRIRVHVDGRPLSSGWTYQPLPNAVVFSREAVPPPGSVIEVTYPVGC